MQFSFDYSHVSNTNSYGHQHQQQQQQHQDQATNVFGSPLVQDGQQQVLMSPYEPPPPLQQQQQQQHQIQAQSQSAQIKQQPPPTPPSSSNSSSGQLNQQTSSQLLQRRMQRLNSDPGNFPPTVETQSLSLENRHNQHQVHHHHQLQQPHSAYPCYPINSGTPTTMATGANHVKHYVHTPPPTTACASVWPMDTQSSSMNTQTSQHHQQQHHHPHSQQVSYSAGYATSHQQQFSFDFTHLPDDHHNHQQLEQKFDNHQNQGQQHQPPLPQHHQTTISPYQKDVNNNSNHEQNLNHHQLSIAPKLEPPIEQHVPPQQTSQHDQVAGDAQQQQPQPQQQPLHTPKPRGRKKKIRTEPIRPICPQCEKQFSNQSALTKHKLTHSDERKFSCQQCSKAFKRHDHLTGHMQTHSNRKPFNCTIQGCDKTYCDARSLRRHKENIHHIITPRDSNGNCSSSSSSSSNVNKYSHQVQLKHDGFEAQHQKEELEHDQVFMSSYEQQQLSSNSTFNNQSSQLLIRRMQRLNSDPGNFPPPVETQNLLADLNQPQHPHSAYSHQTHLIDSSTVGTPTTNLVQAQHYVQTPPPTTASAAIWPMDAQSSNLDSQAHHHHQVSYSAGYVTSHHQQFSFDFSQAPADHNDQDHHQHNQSAQGFDFPHQGQQQQQHHHHQVESSYQAPASSTLSLNQESQLLRRRMQRLNSEPGVIPPVETQGRLVELQQRQPEPTAYSRQAHPVDNTATTPTSKHVQAHQHVQTPPPTASLTSSTNGWPIEHNNLLFNNNNNTMTNMYDY